MQDGIKKLKLRQETVKNLTQKQLPGFHSGGTWCQLCTQ
jgi:hypothetical protein